MASYVLRRLVSAVGVLFGVTLVVFLTIKLIPGDAAIVLAGQNATADQLAELRRIMGLDQPIYIQYFLWITRALHGDLGRSLELNQPVMELVLARYVNTLILAAAAIVISTTLGLTAGIIAALRPRSLLDRFVM